MLGRFRTSTVVLVGLFLATLTLYFLVRPDPLELTEVRQSRTPDTTPRVERTFTPTATRSSGSATPPPSSPAATGTASKSPEITPSTGRPSSVATTPSTPGATPTSPDTAPTSLAPPGTAPTSPALPGTTPS